MGAVPGASSGDVALISPALRGSTIGRLRGLLARHHAEMSRIESELDRFDLLLDRFFFGFPSQNRDLDPETRTFVSCLDHADNLDTGNAPMAPFEPFVAGVLGEAADRERYRRYRSPRPIPELEAATRDFVVRQGLVPAETAERLAVVVGNGTVHLYDVLCRQLLRRPGDVVLMPRVTYGWFLPQVHRARGRVHLLPLDGAGRTPPAAVAGAVDAIEAGDGARWLETLPERLQVHAAELATMAPGEVRPPAEAETRALARALRGATPGEVGDAVLRFVRERVAEGDRARRLASPEAPYPALPAPPKVVALLHINPSLMGVVSGPGDVAELAAVLRQRHVAVIEDLAYHSIGRPLGALGTFLRELPDSYCLLGLSKALSVPNARIGLLLTEASRARALIGGVENSAGHVSTVAQAGLLEALRAAGALDAFLDPGRYDRNRSVLIACLEGLGSPALAGAERGRCEELIREEVRRLVAWKRARGGQVDGPSILAGLDPDDLDGSEASPAELAVAAFLRHGLRRWFRVVRYPDAGFFVVVSCLPLLERGPLAGLPLRSAFDVFAALEFLLGVRTLPGELLGMPADGEPYLRLSFSCGVETIVRAAFLLFVGLNQLSTLPAP